MQASPNTLHEREVIDGEEIGQIVEAHTPERETVTV